MKKIFEIPPLFVQRSLNKNFSILPDGKTIVLWNQDNEKSIQNEYKLLEYLKNLNFPTIKILKTERIKHNQKIFDGLFLEYIPNATFIKISSITSKPNLSFLVKEKFKNFLSLMEKHNIVIEDLQFLVTENDISIIDLSNIHFLTTKTSHFPSTIKFDLVEKIFI